MKTIKTLLTTGAITAFSLSLGIAQQQQPGQPQPSSPGLQSEQPTQPGQSTQAQEQQQSQQQEFGARSSQSAHQKATELKGAKIETQDGQSLGQVEDVAVDLQTGEISFILASGEGGGDQWTPIPPTAGEMKSQAGETTLTLDIDQQKWEQAPKVSENEIAQLGQQQRAQEIYQHFGEDYQARQQQTQQFGAPERPGQSEQQPPQPGGQQSQPESEFGAAQRGQGPTLATKLMEADVSAPDQENAAKVTDMILNLQEGFVELVLIESEYVDGTFGVVPQAFEVIQEDQLRLNVSQEDLEQAQQLQQAQISQRAQQARMASVQQTRQNPEVYRIQEGQDSLFGAPPRGDSETHSEKEKKESMKSESKPGESEPSEY